MRAENYFHPRVRDQSIGELVNVSKKSVEFSSLFNDNRKTGKSNLCMRSISE